MHELSLALSLIEAVAPKVPRKPMLREVHVTVGPLAGVWPDALEFGFTEIARQEGYDNVRLVVHATQAHFACQGCGRDYTTGDAIGTCPDCGSMARKMVSGAEFTLDSIELEE